MGDGRRPDAPILGTGRAENRCASGVSVRGRGLIELELRDRLGSIEIEDRGLIKVKRGLGQTASILPDPCRKKRRRTG